MKLTFCGGARAVTGANYLLETKKARIIIDCGLHQGSRFSERENWDPFPYDPKTIDAVFVTHSHIDHIGRIPFFMKQGFQGTIYSTPPGKDIGELLLLDSEHILREEALKDNREPLYDMHDVVRAMGMWQKRKYHEKIVVGGFTISFINAGHVLGSASVVVEAEGKRIVFSGDLGNNPSPFITGTEYPKDVDYALIEAVYGNRIHEGKDRRHEVLEEVITQTIKVGGVLMIPAFALERTQELLFELNNLVENKKIPRVSIFVDSPLAIKLTAVFQKYSDDPEYFNKSAIELIKRGDAIFNFPGLHLTLTTEQSKGINNVPSPKVIIAGSGMSHAGRILHHEKRYLRDGKNTILFIGYQGEGSLGRRILNGEPTVKIHGEEVPVNARTRAIGGYSAHADQPQLMKWVEQSAPTIKKLFVVQGEDSQALPFAEKVKETFHIDASVPSYGDVVVL